MRYIIVILILSLASCTTTTEQTDTAETENQAQVLQLQQLDGTDINLSTYGDSAIFVNFWATWCGPCIKEMPSLENLQTALKDEPIIFLYASSEPKNKIRKFAERRPWEFNYVHLNMSLQALDIYALPTTYIYKNGEIIWGQTGMREWDDEQTMKEIKELI